MLGTAISLMLEDCAPAVAAARAGLDPEGAARIGLHLTLLYPFVPRSEVTHELIEGLRTFFAEHGSFEFALARVEDFPEVVAYVAPEPDGTLKELMRGALGGATRTPRRTGERSTSRCRTRRSRATRGPR